MAGERDWDSELRKIDKQLQSISDEALAPTGGTAAPQVGSAPRPLASSAGAWGAALRLLLALALAVAMAFWPYESRCGAGLAYYLAGVAACAIAGVWSALASWKRHWALGHVLSLLALAWAVLLAAREILPKTGYAVASERHPTTWSCQPR